MWAGEFGVPAAALSTAVLGSALALMTGHPVAGAVAAACSFALAGWTLQVVCRDLETHELCIFGGGFAVVRNERSEYVPFEEVESTRMEELTHGARRWNRERALWMKTIGGNEYRLGREIRGSSEAMKRLRDHLSAAEWAAGEQPGR